MGKFGSPSFSVFMVDGYDMLASKVQGFTWKITADSQRCDGLGDTWEQNSPTGISKAEIVQRGAYFDDTTNSNHDAFKAAGVTSRVVCWAPVGNVIGSPFRAVAGAYSLGYNVLGKVKGLTNADVSYVVSGQLDRGQILQHWTAKTADWNTKTLGTEVDYATFTGQRVIPITSNSQASPSVVTCPVAHGLTTGQVIVISGVTGSNADINGQNVATVISSTTFSVPVNAGVSGGTGGTFKLASTVNGGAGVLAVSAFSGFTGFVGKIKHSTDDITFNDLVTFTNVTSAPNAQRIEVASGTTVGRYLAFDGDVTGTGSITVFVGFSRN